MLAQIIRIRTFQVRSYRTVHVLIADDHALVRQGLVLTLGALAPEACFSEAADADQVRHALSTDKRPDLVLLDLFMPGNEDFGLLSEVCRKDPDLLIVVLSASTEQAHMRKALDLGASGYIPKSSTADVMLSALRLVLAGGIYLPPDMLQQSAEPRDRPLQRPTVANSSRADAYSDTTLTARQLEVLVCLADGKSNKQIASELNLSENTVKIHVAAILRALGADNRTQAAMAAKNRGLL
jgi:DNA-binding NarL/FixJ family response regulator